ncbi:polysaccharide deacetylase family protein [Plebeiibacterium marinum]|uniref:Polysaccharide deacetylase family protein n=1 Tax=Plebeiibacterium marinum TaxID=2992111 RepID=A0AAE3MDS4_9BACT|nr:polysaccharide deacetylase family protein [Plebeiobacterium marinum]MCW3806088.1 polysaccharide deacetylase family protein [Plebeiobacterium marinum]
MVHPNYALRKIFNGATWLEQTSQNEVFVTFDDGPIPEVTPWVLDEADKWGAKLTFFCVGENVHKHPDVYQEVLKRGHAVGNHTYNHIKAFSYSKKDYFKNIDKASELIETTLFRPPHGYLYPWYVKPLKKKFEKIVMWDILSRDYDQDFNKESVFVNVEKYLRPGAVIVFHDSLKAEKNMKYAFPKTLELINKRNYTASSIR